MNKFEYPSIGKANLLIEEAERLNPGRWIDHSIYTAKAARNISEKVCGLDSEAAYVFGLLHDIGRREGVHNMRHIIDGYNFMIRTGYEFVARICMTHSFPLQEVNAVFGQWDCTDEEYNFVEDYMSEVEYNDYDRLIQLSDALAMPGGFCIVEKRFVDVAMRYTINKYTIPKWRATLDIKEDFEKRIGSSIYELLPGIVEHTLN